MLSTSNLSAAQAETYYTKEDYYSKEEKAHPTKWVGKGAAALGLSGVVNQQDFSNLLAGKSPDGQSLTGRVVAPEKRRAGTDFTFSAPKSVSIAALVQQDERVLAAHHQAVGKALSVLEERYAQTRVSTPTGRSQPTSDGVDIVLDRLPQPMAPGERSLGGTIRIFFQKIMSRKLGLAFEYPQLSGIYLLGDRRVVYEKEPTVLQPQIAQAKRILLLIHGLFGDTPSLMTDLQSGDECARFLGDRYDLILGLDYESFNTSVEDTARQLKQRLERVGLGANHKKQLDMVGVELGGLIGRWFVERGGGNAIVNHLVLVGAPNAGTPWSTVQAWSTAALGIGLNSLSTVAWPVKVMGSLVAAIEAFDVTLDQMQPGSGLLQSLAASPDPGMAYSVLYGNASINPSALSTESRAKSLLQRLLDKLLGSAANLAFLGQPNDLFASTYSLKLPTESRALAPAMEEALCDHFTYFSSPEGQAALMQVLSRM